MSSKHLSWFVKRFIQMGLVSIDIHRYVVDFESVIHQESVNVSKTFIIVWGYDLFKLIWLLLKDIDSLDILRMLNYYLGTMGVASSISPHGQGGYYSLSLRGHGVFLFDTGN